MINSVTVLPHLAFAHIGTTFSFDGLYTYVSPVSLWICHILFAKITTASDRDTAVKLIYCQ